MMFPDSKFTKYNKGKKTKEIMFVVFTSQGVLKTSVVTGSRDWSHRWCMPEGCLLRWLIRNQLDEISYKQAYFNHWFNIGDDDVSNINTYLVPNRAGSPRGLIVIETDLQGRNVKKWIGHIDQIEPSLNN